MYFLFPDDVFSVLQISPFFLEDASQPILLCIFFSQFCFVGGHFHSVLFCIICFVIVYFLFHDCVFSDHDCVFSVFVLH